MKEATGYTFPSEAEQIIKFSPKLSKEIGLVSKAKPDCDLASPCFLYHKGMRHNPKDLPVCHLHSLLELCCTTDYQIKHKS